MPATYEPIATTTLGSAQGSITFSSIPGTYTDLKLILVHTYATGSGSDSVYFNNDINTNYSQTNLYGNGTTAASTNATNGSSWTIASDIVAGSTTIPLLVEIDIFSYAGSTFKTGLIKSSEDYNGNGATMSRTALYRSTSAITTLILQRSGGNYAIGTTATLYGIKSA